MKKQLKKCFALLMSFVMLIGIAPIARAESQPRIYTEQEIQQVADGIISWCREQYGAAEGETLFNELYLSGAGMGGCEWFPLGMSRSGWEDDYSLYLDALAEQIRERYKKEEKLDRTKATEWHRIIISVLACGGDPTAVTYDEYGNVINLIEDGVYNRGLVKSLGAQGINGWTWGLIALDTMRYEIPEGSYYSRDDIIEQILMAQLDDGGYDFSGRSADPDMTAMALQALTPYYNSEKEYTYTRKNQTEPETKTVRQVIDEGIAALSKIQDDDGGFSSWGTPSSESADQVLVALCGLGIDPQTDERFIKNGNTILDSLMSYRMEDGGFLHAKLYDPENPTSLPDESNEMASYQTLYALAAVLRYMRGESSLYDFRDAGSDMTPPNDPDAVLTKINSAEVSREIADEMIFPAEKRAEVEKMLSESEISTQYYADIALAVSEIESLPEFTGRADLLSRLNGRKDEILSLADEITALNSDIAAARDKLTNGTLADKGTVDALYKRMTALPEYDLTMVEDRELLILAKEAADGAMGKVIAAGCCAAVFVVAVILFSVKKRRDGAK